MAPTARFQRLQVGWGASGQAGPPPPPGHLGPLPFCSKKGVLPPLLPCRAAHPGGPGQDLGDPDGAGGQAGGGERGRGLL